MVLAQFTTGLPSPREKSGVFSVEAFLASRSSEEIVLLPESLEIYGKLRRKVEVARRLFAHYTADIARPAGDDIVHPGYAQLLCAQFLIIAQKSGDPRVLNAALKMLDGILLAPVVSPLPALDVWAKRIVGGVRLADA